MLRRVRRAGAVTGVVPDTLVAPEEVSESEVALVRAGLAALPSPDRMGVSGSAWLTPEMTKLFPRGTGQTDSERPLEVVDAEDLLEEHDPRPAPAGGQHDSRVEAAPVCRGHPHDLLVHASLAFSRDSPAAPA